MAKFLKIETWLFLLALIALLFFSLYKLTESPPTWYDEGMIMQVAINMLHHGRAGIQVAPGELASAGHVSTGFPVIYPLSVVFRIAGVGLLQARLLMVAFLLAFFIAFSYFARSISGSRIWLYSVFLLASFAPLYGNGKNVLGEVPGLLFLALALIFLYRFENSGKMRDVFLASFFAGLSATTKPIFLLLIPAAILAIFLMRRVLPNRRLVLGAIIFFLAPFALWLPFQFESNDSFGEILSFYANPYRLGDLQTVLLANLYHIVTSPEALFTAAIFIFWAVSLFLRRRERLWLAELVAFIFTSLVLLSYLRTPGWHRYFFPAHVVALIYFPASFFLTYGMIREWVKARFPPSFSWPAFLLPHQNATSVGSWCGGLPAAFICFLVIFQFYQLGFNSWVADYYGNHRTAILKDYFRSLDSAASIFVYDAPEIVPFLPSANYYQYMSSGNIWVIGDAELNKLRDGVPQFVVVPNERWQEEKGLFARYTLRDTIDRYVVLGR